MRNFLYTRSELACSANYWCGLRIAAYNVVFHVRVLFVVCFGGVPDVFDRVSHSVAKKRNAHVCDRKSYVRIFFEEAASRVVLSF